MPAHSSTLAWEISWTEEPGGLQFIGSQELDTTEQINNNKKRTPGFAFEFEIVKITQIKFLIIVKYLGNLSTGK